MNQRTIDTHSHILTLETAALITKVAPNVSVTITTYDANNADLKVGSLAYRPFPTGGYDIPQRLKDMDAAGVDVQVLSCTPQTYLYNLGDELSPLVATIQNDQMAKHVAEHPTRFMAIATLPIGQPKAAADELKRVINKLGFKGAMIASNFGGRYLGEPEFEPLWAAAEELRAFMFVHPDNVAGQDRLGPYYLRNLIGNPLDTTIAAASLYFGGVMDRFPKLKVMLAHGGGFTPYQAPRWEHGWKARPEPKKFVKTQPVNIAGRFFYDTILHSEKTLEAMIGLVGVDKVMLGSDYPYDMEMRDCVAHVRGLNISDADKTAILSGNFEKLLAGVAK